MNLFDDLKQGLQEAISFAEGTGTAKTCTLTSNNDKANPIGDSWEDVKKELFTPEEIVEIEASASKMGELAEFRSMMEETRKWAAENGMTEDDITQAIATIRKRKRILTEAEVMESLGITEDEINSANDLEIE